MIRKAASRISQYGFGLKTQLLRKQFSHAVGEKYTNPIRLSTADLLRQMAEKYPDSIGINSYDQQISLTYK